MSIQDVAEHELTLLPTPTASEGAKGGPNQQYSSGGATLSGTVPHLLPTTTTTRDSAASGGSSKANVTLTDAVVRSELGTRDNPRHLPTPRASRGASSTETAYALGGERIDADRTQGEVIVGSVEWGPYRTAIRRWERVLGRPAPPPVRNDGRNGKARLNPELTEWMMGWPAGWVTDPALGLSREQQLKACGNGVVPQQAEAALREMLAREGVPSV